MGVALWLYLWEAKMKDKNIKCISCKYAKADTRASTKDWTAYECTNPDSEYYRCLLNVTINGEKTIQNNMVWLRRRTGQVE